MCNAKTKLPEKSVRQNYGLGYHWLKEYENRKCSEQLKFTLMDLDDQEEIWHFFVQSIRFITVNVNIGNPQCLSYTLQGMIIQTNMLPFLRASLYITALNSYSSPFSKACYYAHFGG